ncbi:MAG: S16 family serine protease, partial [Candidatus Micrarchaeia archaeon]
VTPSASRSEGRVIATGKLGQIAKEAVDNVSAILKKYESKDLSQKDIHIQFLQTYEGVEGDSASISIAVGVISALEGIPLDQSFALTGSLSVRGDSLPVGGINGKIEAAIDAGMKSVIIPKANEMDVYLPKESLSKIKVIPVSTIAEVLDYVLEDSPRKKKLVSEIKKNMKKEEKN